MKIIKTMDRRPWRLFDAWGNQVFAPERFDKPDPSMSPISGDTKKECLQWAMDYLEYLHKKERKQNES